MSANGATKAVTGLSFRGLAFLTCAGAVVAALLASTSLAQEAGRTATLTLRQGIESIREQDQDGTEERTLSNTDVTATLSSVTRSDTLSLTLATRLRGATGDLPEREREGFALDRTRLGLTYRHRAPGTVLEGSASLQRDDINFLRPADLIEQPDGTTEVPDDIEDLDGTGLRTNTRLRLAARFGERTPFGWGIAVNTTQLRYQDVEDPDLNDSDRINTALTGRFDFTEVLSLSTELTQSRRQSENGSDGITNGLEATFNLRAADRSTYRLGTTLEQPDDGNDRFTFFLGRAQQIEGGRTLDANLGATMIENGEASLTGRLIYNERLTPLVIAGVGLSARVRDTVDNETVRDSAAIVRVRTALTALNRVSFGVVYGARDNLDTDQQSTVSRLSVSYDQRLNEDWEFSVGARQILREQTGLDLETEERLFFTINRSWDGRF